MGPEVTGMRVRVEVALAVALGVTPDGGRAVGVPVGASTDGGGTDAVAPASPAGVGMPPPLSPPEKAGTGVKVAGTLVSTGDGSAATAEGVAEAAVSTEVGLAGKTGVGAPVEAAGVAVGTGNGLTSQPHRYNIKIASNAVRAPTLLFTRGRWVEGEGRACPAVSSRATGIATGGRGKW